MADAVMSVVMLKYGIQRSCTHEAQVKGHRSLPVSHFAPLTSICLLLKTLLMLELKVAPENMEVTGYVKSRTFRNTEVISCRRTSRRERTHSFLLADWLRQPLL